MSDVERKRSLVELEAEYRRTETALAIAQADHEKAYAAIWSYMNDAADGPHRTISISPEITIH